MKRWTHREYRTRSAWLDEQWNQPSRSDQYLMQIAMEVRRVLSKKPNVIQLDHFKLKFQSTEAKPTPKLSVAELTKQSIARWCGFVGLKKERKE